MGALPANTIVTWGPLEERGEHLCAVTIRLAAVSAIWLIQSCSFAPPANRRL
jgi:hypothetical protein